MPAPHLGAVVFDLDGLLFNTEELYEDVGGELLGRRGKTYDRPLIDQMMGRPAPVALQILVDWHSLPDSVADLAIEAEAIFAGILDRRLAFMPGVPELLAALEAAGLPKAIATSSGRRFVERVLAPFDLAPRFAFALTAEDVTQGKPHPEIYLKASARLDLPPAEVMVLEDSHNGCRAAAAAGTFAVAVPGPHSRTHDFSCASMVIQSLADRRLYEVLGIGAGPLSADGGAE
jgi:HAD superfamily hydrolase (TIGR01509 family)